jgi:hypothetical protein
MLLQQIQDKIIYFYYALCKEIKRKRIVTRLFGAQETEEKRRKNIYIWRAAQARYPSSINLDFLLILKQFITVRKMQLLRASPESSVPYFVMNSFTLIYVIALIMRN